MNILNLLTNPEIINIKKDLNKLEKEVSNNNFNLLSVSTYTSHLENFHSDIIGFLLNQNEIHQHQNIYLQLFIKYLKSLGTRIESYEYLSCEVTREKGRIDIWIKDTITKKSIIIENKINNASDQNNQITNYYNLAINKGYTVDCIVYLSLNGHQAAPYTGDEKIDTLIKNIAAFNNDKNDLVNGWLEKCYNDSDSEDTKSFLFQYIKLIKNLSKKGMDKKLKDDFYNIIKSEENYNTAKLILTLLNDLETYRADTFIQKIGNNYKPFTKKYRYRPNHWLFENYLEDNNSFKLDVYFTNNGNARIDFWNPHKPEDIQEKTCSEKLESLDLLKDFTYGGFGGGLYKTFEINTYKTIENVDNEVTTYVKNFFKKLNHHNNLSPSAS